MSTKGSELFDIEELLCARLREDRDEADGGLMSLNIAGVPLAGFYIAHADPNVPVGRPYVLCRLQSPGVDEGTLCGDIVGTNPLYLVVVVGRGTGFAPMRAAVERIHSRLHGLQYTTPGEVVITCVRESPFRLAIPAGVGGPYDYLAGGQYRFTASS